MTPAVWAPLRAVLAVFRRYERELVCGRCRAVVAWIRLRPFSLIRITDRGGHPVNPLGGMVATRITQARLADAERERDHVDGLLDLLADADAEVARYHRDLAYLRRAAGEVIYEFTCATCGARYLRSLPHLSATVRKATTGRVRLG